MSAAKILVIDDDAVARELLADALKKDGHEERKTLSCPKSSGYNFVANQKPTTTDEQNHIDPRDTSSSSSESQRV
jgi:CheY-like chemotaxis protein